MNLLKRRSVLLSILTLGSVTGISTATVYADEDSAIASTSATCEQIMDILKKGRPGTLSYIRMKDQYNRRCLEIKAGCPSLANLALHAKSCTDAGMYTHYYIDPSSCKKVRCAMTPPSSSSSSSSPSSSSSIAPQNGPCPNGDMMTAIAVACKAKNLKYEYTTQNGCRTVRCIEKAATGSSCPSAETMRNKASDCKAKGHRYESYTTGVCKMVRCVNEGIDVAPCPDDAAINAAGAYCKKQGYTPSVISEKNGCRKVTCTKPSSLSSSSTSSSSTACPTDDQLDQGIRVCKNSGLTGTTMKDEYGCRQVICQTR